MSHRDTLRALDAVVHGALSAVGFAELATYTPPSGPAVQNVRVHRHDVALEEQGENGRFVSERVEYSIHREDVPDPRRGATLLVDGGTYKLESKASQDPSITRWVVAGA